MFPGVWIYCCPHWSQTEGIFWNLMTEVQCRQDHTMGKDMNMTMDMVMKV